MSDKLQLNWTYHRDLDGSSIFSTQKNGTSYLLQISDSTVSLLRAEKGHYELILSQAIKEYPSDVNEILRCAESTLDSPMSLLVRAMD